MEDTDIVELYHRRSEAAVSESIKKYGRYCYKIADNILRCHEDNEECVNETWEKAWNAMPPDRPSRLSVFLGRITRNLSIDRYRRKKAEKYGKGQISLCLEELAECVGEEDGALDGVELRETLDSFLAELDERTKELFMLRYWYMFSVKEAADRCKMTEGAAKMSLQRTRDKLKKFLVQEGLI